MRRFMHISTSPPGKNRRSIMPELLKFLLTLLPLERVGPGGGDPQQGPGPAGSPWNSKDEDRLAFLGQRTLPAGLQAHCADSKRQTLELSLVLETLHTPRLPPTFP